MLPRRRIAALMEGLVRRGMSTEAYGDKGAEQNSRARA